MTSATFSILPIDSITIERESRQRRTLRGVKELAASIAEVGLINPPVVTRDHILVAGERRAEACRSLGWTSLPVQFAEDLDHRTLQLIELEENVKRIDLTWQEQNDAIARFHTMQAETRPEWTQDATGEALGMSASAVQKHLLVHRARDSVADIDSAEKFSTAIGLATRAEERKRNVTQQKAEAPMAAFGFTAPAPEPAPASDRPASVLTADFTEWAAQPRTPFNLIHCDFPYGVSTGDKKGQSAAKRLGGYDDGEHVYWALVETLLTQQDNFIEPSAHLIFWYSMKFYTRTVEALESAGWKVDPFPLIWHKSDNAGIIPDANRGPRRAYETALFASRGDRKVVRPVANLFSGPTTKQFHTSEKSGDMLAHFYRMLLDGSTRLLDPTCGSGMAIREAEKAGAAYALGLERDPEFAQAARRNCKLVEH